MDYKFQVKKLKIPLFGVVEVDDKEPFWSRFAQTANVSTVFVDGAVQDILAEELERDAEGLLYDAERYTTGKYRQKARGFSGGTLGDFGEVLTYLLNQAVSGRELVRIVSYDAAGLRGSGHTFPQPDFLVQEGEKTGVLEVKSTEALDYQKLLAVDKVRGWKWLTPCDEIGPRREDALHQLGYVNGEAVQQQHRLVLHAGNIVPFPADFGVATAVLAFDGRVQQLRGDRRFKTRKACREAPSPRDCWLCMESDDGAAHVIVTEMRNEPARLALLPFEGQGPTWIRTYRRWAQAVWAEEPHALRQTSASLGRATAAWLIGDEIEAARRKLVAFWYAYLWDIATDRGIQLDDLALPVEAADVEVELGWTPPPLREPVVQDTTLDLLIQRWPGADDARQPARYAIVERDSGNNVVESFLVRVTTDDWSLTCLSREWWSEQGIGKKEASRIAGDLVRMALTLDDWLGPAAESPTVPLRSAVARVNHDQRTLGWVAESMADDPAAWRDSWVHWWWPERLPERGPLWLLLLAAGDPRTRLVVLPDGRARLRLPHVLSRSR